MTNIQWPNGIPYSDLNWTSNRTNSNIVFTPERGNTKSRRTSTKPVETLAVAITVTPYQAQVFMHWYTFTLIHGSLTFLYPDFIYNGDDRESFFTTTPAISKVSQNEVKINFNLEFVL